MLKLKYLSFIALNPTVGYDSLFVPLLCRMIKSVIRFDSIYIDGIQLYDQFLIYMTKLKKFTFYINTVVSNFRARLELPTNEDIGRGYQKVAS